MKHIGCMVTGIPVTIDPGTYGESTGAIVVMHNGAIIGVVSPSAQIDVQTLRMTFTRDRPKGEFMALQGVTVQQFKPVEHHDTL